MDARVESGTSGIDTAKLIMAILVLIGGIVAFYYFRDEWTLLYRVVAMLAATIGSFGLIMTTAIGKSFLGFLRDSRVEVRKMVWPTRQETVQTTLIVVALVFLVGLLLWTLDAMLFWGISHLTGQGK